MTGTAMTESEEFHQIYKLGRGRSAIEPSNGPPGPLQTAFTVTETAKFKAIVQRGEDVTRKGPAGAYRYGYY